MNYWNYSIIQYRSLFSLPNVQKIGIPHVDIMIWVTIKMSTTIALYLTMARQTYFKTMDHLYDLCNALALKSVCRNYSKKSFKWSDFNYRVNHSYVKLIYNITMTGWKLDVWLNFLTIIIVFSFHQLIPTLLFLLFCGYLT